MIQTDAEKIDDTLRTECPFCHVTLASNAIHQHIPEDCEAL